MNYDDSKHYRLVFPINGTPFCLINSDRNIAFLQKHYPTAIDLEPWMDEITFVINQKVVNQKEYELLIFNQEMQDLLAK